MRPTTLPYRSSLRRDYLLTACLTADGYHVVWSDLSKEAYYLRYCMYERAQCDCLPAVSQSAPLYGAVSLDCSLTLSITTSYCPCFVATNASRSQGQPLSATPDAPSAFPSSTNSKRKDSLISVLMGSKRLHLGHLAQEVHMIEQNTLLPRVTVHMSHDCDCRDIPDDGSGVDELLALGMDGTASLEESERMLVLGLTDCIDAFEGVLVDSASQNSLVVKDVFVDHKANLNDLMVAAPVGEFSGPE
ncbi:hypothetical protein KCU79_g62, partial [Aureobasidium melanogenum]